MEAQDFGMSKATDHSASVRAREGMGCVKDQGEVVATRELREGIDMAWLTPEMNAKNPRSVGCKSALNTIGIQTMGFRIYVCEHRSNPLPLERMSRRNKREG